MSAVVPSLESAPLQSVEFISAYDELLYFEHCKPFELDYYPEAKVWDYYFPWAKDKGELVMEQIRLRFAYRGFVIVGQTLRPLYKDLRTKRHVVIQQAEEDQSASCTTPHVVDFHFFQHRD